MELKPYIKDILKWDINSWKKALVFWEKEIEWSNINHCLELGGNEGGLSLWLALKGKHVVCSDIQEKKEVAQSLHQKHHVNHLISYEVIDATKIPYQNHFDLIVFKSVLGGVGRENNKQAQQEAIHQIYNALKPGGVLFFAENTTASVLHQKLRKRNISWANSWRYISANEMREFLTPFTTYTLHTTGFLATFGRTENQRNILAHLDKLFFNPLLSQQQHYIVYGIAKK